MSEPSILHLLKHQFEPFFLEDILPELEVPEIFSMSCSSSDGSNLDIRVHINLLRAIKGEKDIDACLRELGYYTQLGTDDSVSVWKRGAVLVTITPSSVRIFEYPSEFILPSRCLELLIYTRDEGDREKRDMRFSIWGNAFIPIVEYAEFFRGGKFNSFDIRDRIPQDPTHDQVMNLHTESHHLLKGDIGNEYLNSPTQYLGRILALMNML